MNKPSKWTDVIKAWADGVPCQYRCIGEPWVDLSRPGVRDWNQPGWLEAEGHEYRTKPTIRRLNRLPAIGSIWPGEDAIYAGLVRGIDGQTDYHLLVPIESGETTAVTWAKARDWAASYDLTLPNRQEARTLWANVPELFASEWYWLDTQFAGNEACAQAQNFGNGNQYVYHKNGAFRARPIRRIPVDQVELGHDA